MAEFTPGPWVAVGAWVEHPDDDRADVCICDPLYFGQQQFGRSASEILANARLIAAAPELYAALLPFAKHPTSHEANDGIGVDLKQSFEEFCQEMKLWDEAIMNARAILSRARGEAK